MSEQEQTLARLAELRAEIDLVDQRLLELLAQRNSLVGHVAQAKRTSHVPIRDTVRETKMLRERLARAAELGLSPDVVEALFRQILWASRNRQASLRAALPVDSEPVDVVIIGGRGGMGSLFRRVFEGLGHRVRVVDLDTQLEGPEAAAGADVVVISVPIRVTAQVIAEIGPHVREDALLMDLTSTKTRPVEAMLNCTRACVIGTHPLFGPVVNSLQGQRIVFTPGRRGPGRDWAAWLRGICEAVELEVIETSPEHHDRVMAIVQVLTHHATEVLGRTMRALDISVEETLRFTSPIYNIELLMAARHFAQSPDLYSAIQMDNPNTEQVMGALSDAATDLRAVVASGDADAFRERFEEVHAFFGEFSETALAQSRHLIDRLVERR